MKLNLAETYIGTEVLGPGKRLVIWTQGCKRDCEGCIDQNWQQLKANKMIDLQELFENVWELRNRLEGITISGGEPFLQAKELNFLLKGIKEHTELGVIVFTGYEYQELLDVDNKFYHSLLENIDLLIAGPYIEKLNDDQGLRGSSNQEFHYLTSRYLPYKKELEEGERKVEISIEDGTVLLVGVPSQEVLSQFKERGSKKDERNVAKRR